MACQVDRDEHGTTYTIAEDKSAQTPGGHQLPGCSMLEVWWARRFRDRRDETLLIKQDNRNGQADVIEMTLGQVFDMIEALNKAVEDL